MADDISAGSISVELKAQFDNLAAGILQAQVALSTFAQETGDTAEKVNKSGQKMSDGFDSGSLGSLRAQERFARLGLQMIVMQNALSQLSSHSQTSFDGINVAANAGAVGLEKFLIVFGSFPTPTTAALGIVIGLAEALNVAGKAIDEITKKMDDLNKKIKDTTAKNIVSIAKEDSKTQLIPGAAGDIQKSLDQQTAAFDTANKFVHQYDEAVAQAAKDVPLLNDKIAALSKELKDIQEVSNTSPEPAVFSGQIIDLTEQLKKLVTQKIAAEDAVESLRRALTNIGIDANNPANALKTLADRIDNLREALKLVNSGEFGLQKVQDRLAAIGELGGKELELGIITPLQASQKDLTATQAALEKILQYQIAIRKAADLTTDDELRSKLLAQGDSLDSTIGVLTGRLKTDQTQVNASQQAGEYAKGLSKSIGDAISQGILNGEKAMQILSNVGKNLFSNMLTQSVDLFEKSMVKAFQSIAGTGGEVLGAALTAVLGVVGGILSRGKSGTVTNAAIQSQITSTQAVQGIVAGPTNVAIEQVGSDLARANAPVIQRLETMIGLLTSIDRKSGGGGGGGFQFAGATSTP